MVAYFATRCLSRCGPDPGRVPRSRSSLHRGRSVRRSVPHGIHRPSMLLVPWEWSMWRLARADWFRGTCVSKVPSQHREGQACCAASSAGGTGRLRVGGTTLGCDG